MFDPESEAPPPRLALLIRLRGAFAREESDDTRAWLERHSEFGAPSDVPSEFQFLLLIPFEVADLDAWLVETAPNEMLADLFRETAAQARREPPMPGSYRTYEVTLSREMGGD